MVNPWRWSLCHRHWCVFSPEQSLATVHIPDRLVEDLLAEVALMLALRVITLAQVVLPRKDIGKGREGPMVGWGVDTSDKK